MNSEMSSTSEKSAVAATPPVPFIFTLISNIPLDFHTPDLRNYFAYAVEKEWFVCFNYRQRPHPSRSFNLAICKVRAARFDELVVLYDKKNWVDAHGLLKKTKCSIAKIKVAPAAAANLKEPADRADGADLEAGGLTESELDELLEFRKIPAWMPAGNVGTPTRVFVDYINRCVFPQSLIAKLGVNLSSYKKNAKTRVYSNVEYSYDESTARSSRTDVEHVSVARTANGHAIDEAIDDETRISELNHKRQEKAAATAASAASTGKGEEEKEEDADGDELEEWERHEALHDDVTKQDRTSPYFFEHEIELKWEKGGSGLVFYTDDNFWKEHEGKNDFDAETADDWDVDMSAYYEESGGDRDARELVDMRRQELLRSGADKSLFDETETRRNVFAKRPAHQATQRPRPYGPRFDHYNKGIGRVLLEKHGWKEGDTVGLPGRSGLREALDAGDGKTNPADKTGLGYHGPKVDRAKIIDALRARRAREHQNAPYYIASKFDADANKPETVLRRFDPTMKYRRPEQDDDDDDDVGNQDDAACKYEKSTKDSSS